MSGYRLDARGVSVSAGDLRIVQPLNLSLRSGELVALLGPSGSGKSTLLRALNGFRPGAGKVLVNGEELYRDFEQLKTLVGFGPQDDGVHPGLTVAKTLDYAAQLRLPADMPDVRRDAAVREVLTQVELTERADVRVRNLSGGQRKRVSIAVELLAKPPLLFLDEPTSGLDPALEERTMQLFRRLTGPDRLTLVTTHVLASLDVVDVVLIVSAGFLVYVGPPSEAPSFFGVADLPSIYKRLAKDPPREWANKLLASPLHQAYVGERLAIEPPSLPVPGATPAARAPSPCPRPLPTSSPVSPAPEADPPESPASSDAPAPVATQPESQPPPNTVAPPKRSPEEELARLKALRGKK